MRDVIAEWRRALVRREATYRAYATTAPIKSPPTSRRQAVSAAPDATVPLAPRARLDGDTGDLAAAIRVMQHANPLLRSRFGIDWTDATTFVLGESHRRGTSVSSMARTVARSMREVR